MSDNPVIAALLIRAKVASCRHYGEGPSVGVKAAYERGYVHKETEGLGGSLWEHNSAVAGLEQRLVDDAIQERGIRE